MTVPRPNHAQENQGLGSRRLGFRVEGLNLGPPMHLRALPTFVRQRGGDAQAHCLSLGDVQNLTQNTGV